MAVVMVVRLRTLIVVEPVMISGGKGCSRTKTRTSAAQSLLVANQLYSQGPAECLRSTTVLETVDVS